MKLTNQQAQLLLQVLIDSLKLHDNGNVFSYSRDVRMKLYDDIIQQQSSVPVELEVKIDE